MKMVFCLACMLACYLKFYIFCWHLISINFQAINSWNIPLTILFIHVVKFMRNFFNVHYECNIWFIPIHAIYDDRKNLL